MKLFQNDQFTLSREDVQKLGEGLDRLQRTMESIADRVYNLETIGKLQNESFESLNSDFQAANDQIKKISTVMVDNIYPAMEALDKRAKKLESEAPQIAHALSQLMKILEYQEHQIKQLQSK